VFFNLCSFVSSSSIYGINNSVSEFVKGTNNLSNDSLVSEILFGGKSNQSFDEGGVFGVGLDSGFDLSE
jgi:hypothetical protein